MIEVEHGREDRRFLSEAKVIIFYEEDKAPLWGDEEWWLDRRCEGTSYLPLRRDSII
jgi:hypothetical protein